MTTATTTAPVLPASPPEPRRTFRAEKISRNFLLGFTPRDYDGDAYRIMVETLKIPQPDGRISTRLGFPVLLLSGLTDEPGEVAHKFARILTEHYEATDTVTISRAEFDALQDEQRHWRESAACAMFDLVSRLERQDYRLSTFGPKVSRTVIVQQLRDWTQMLVDALAGDFSPSCVGCGKPVRPGDICFPYTDEVSHHDCDHPRPGKHQAGETISVKDAVFTDEAGDETTGPGDVELYAYPPLFTLEGLQKLCAQAAPMCGLESLPAADAKAEVA